MTGHALLGKLVKWYYDGVQKDERGDARQYKTTGRSDETPRKVWPPSLQLARACVGPGVPPMITNY